MLVPVNEPVGFVKPCVCVEFEPLEVVDDILPSLLVNFAQVDEFAPSLIKLPIWWLCEASCAVLNELALTEPPDIETLPETDLVPKAVVKDMEPPELAVPLTIRNALLSCAVDLVHPVGADVCTNNIAVPLGKALGLAPLDAAVNRPCASTVMLA